MHPSAPGERPEVFHLAGIFEEYSDPIEFQNDVYVGLNDRVRPAHDLSAAILEFHKIKWLHKHILSYNILFFGAETIPGGGIGDQGGVGGNEVNGQLDGKGRLRKVNLRTPSLIGFSRSQPGNADCSGEMHSADEALLAYIHPDYAGADAVDYALHRFRSVPLLVSKVDEINAKAADMCLSGRLSARTGEGGRKL